MNSRMHLTAICLLFAIYSFAQLPDCDIWLFKLQDSASATYFSSPRNITSRKGYDNQPMFSPDSRYLLYSSQVDSGGQTDIYKYDLASGKRMQITKTPESEYSPTFTPDNNFFSVVRVEKDSAQRLWKFPLKGGDPVLLTPKIKDIGYHCWVSPDSVALFVLTKPDFTLQIAELSTQRTRVIADSLGRCMRMKDGALWFTIKMGRFNTVYAFNMKTGEYKLYGVTESEDYAFHSSGQVWSFSDDMIVSGFMSSEDGASEVVDLSKYGIKNPSRLAISPNGKWMAVVSNP